MTWGTGADMEELRIQLKDTRIIRLALDSLEEHLPTQGWGQSKDHGL